MFATVFATVLSLAFPAERQRLTPGIDRTYVIGACGTNAPTEALTVNGVTTDVYRSGAFILMTPVTVGTNTLEAVCGTNRLVRTFVVPPLPPPASGKAPSPPRDVYADLGISSNATWAVRPPRTARPQDVVVFVDAGHGGGDAGALSPHGYREKDANLLQALAVRDELKRAGFDVRLTREDDSFPALYDRPRAAVEARADAFVSIHHNASAERTDPRTIRHTVAYAWNDAGLALAKAVQKHIAAAQPDVSDRGAQTKSLAVCRNPAVPSCLVEIDFMTTPEGEENVFDTAHRTRIATAIAAGFLDWLWAPKEKPAP